MAKADEGSVKKPMKGGLTKKEIYKLKPGTWLRIKWDDAPEENVLLVEKVEEEKGDLEIRIWSSTRHTLYWVTHGQVVKVVGQIQIPA